MLLLTYTYIFYILYTYIFYSLYTYISIIGGADWLVVLIGTDQNLIEVFLGSQNCRLKVDLSQ